MSNKRDYMYKGAYRLMHHNAVYHFCYVFFGHCHRQNESRNAQPWLWLLISVRYVS